MSIGHFPESLSPAMLVGIMLIGRLGVSTCDHVVPRTAKRPPVPLARRWYAAQYCALQGRDAASGFRVLGF